MKGDRVMAYEINNKCTACGKCEFTCPEGAITHGWKKYEIDADLCDSCGSCKYACPVDAIEEDW